MTGMTRPSSIRWSNRFQNRIVSFSAGMPGSRSRPN
jgi:hypothetical protein